MSNSASEADKAMYANAFIIFDYNADGSIDKDEFKKAGSRFISELLPSMSISYHAGEECRRLGPPLPTATTPTTPAAFPERLTS